MAESRTETIVVAEGRRMMRLSSELSPEVFEALLAEYHRLLREVFGSLGGRELEVDGDTVVAAFATATQAALAAVAGQRSVADHEWPHGRLLAISVGLATGPVEAATLRCEELCDAAEGGQIFLTQELGRLLEKGELGELEVRDLGEVPLRRTEQNVRAYELVY
jgi:class 3 adenylate cyclase